MIFSAILTFVFLLSASAAPTLDKRAEETIYLVNGVSGGVNGEQPAGSQIWYFANGSDGDFPSSDNTCTVQSAGSYKTWEGSQISCKFPTGVTFTSNIDSDAQSKSVDASVGTGWNDYHHYICYKGDKGRIASNGSSGAYYRFFNIYYCRQG